VAAGASVAVGWLAQALSAKVAIKMIARRVERGFFISFFSFWIMVILTSRILVSVYRIPFYHYPYNSRFDIMYSIMEYIGED
jgi:hypothetical protein